MSASPPAPPRVRIAPAPSGVLHVGSVRTALYNWLYARRHRGTFVFRIEDTDADRATGSSMQSMLDAMAWMGLDWDEGIEHAGNGGGAHGPYQQSQRTGLYLAVARRLEEGGHTWRDHRTTEELDGWRKQQQQAGLPPAVHAPTDADHLGDPAAPSVLRLRLPTSGTTVVPDLVKGDVTFDWANESDPVLVRSNGAPTYPLANSVDDVAQGITLVCRGEDLLSVTPRQQVLYDLLTRPDPDDGAGMAVIDAALAEVGLPARLPSWGPPTQFAHLGLIVGADRKKLSKRHGSVAVQEFERQGFLPAALRNYLALLGWSPGDGRERMTDAELVAAFDFAQVNTAPAAFDVEKLTAFNGEQIRAMEPEELATRLLPYLDGTHQGPAAAIGADGLPAAVDPATLQPVIAHPASDEELRTLVRLVPLVQERMQLLAEVQRYAPAFFGERVRLDPAAVQKVLGKAPARQVLEGAQRVLGALESFDDAGVEEALRGLKDELGIGAGKVFAPIRVAVTGSTVSPPLFESITLIGRNRTLARLAAALPHCTA